MIRGQRTLTWLIWSCQAIVFDSYHDFRVWSVLSKLHQNRWHVSHISRWLSINLFLIQMFCLRSVHPLISQFQYKKKRKSVIAIFMALSRVGGRALGKPALFLKHRRPASLLQKPKKSRALRALPAE